VVSDENWVRLDLLGWVEPLGTYEHLLRGSEIIDLGSVAVRVIGLVDLIKIKRHINRPKDQLALLQLEALKRLREGRD
jgi:predicted nucleotidyltransferase